MKEPEPLKIMFHETLRFQDHMQPEYVAMRSIQAHMPNLNQQPWTVFLSVELAMNNLVQIC